MKIRLARRCSGETACPTKQHHRNEEGGLTTRRRTPSDTILPHRLRDKSWRAATSCAVCNTFFGTSNSSKVGQAVSPAVPDQLRIFSNRYNPASENTASGDQAAISGGR